MTIDEVREFALGMDEAVEEHPFGPTVDVIKVAGKIFALLAPDDEPPRVSLKCEPRRAIQLRQTYKSIIPGYHLNKRHWNTVTLDGSVPDAKIEEMIRHSHEQVVAKLPKADRVRLRGY